MQRKTDDKKRNALKEIFFLYCAIFFFWTLYRIFFSLPQWIDEFIAKPIIWVLPFILLHKKMWKQTVKLLKINISQNIILGLFVGICYFVGYTGISYIARGAPSFNPDHLINEELILQFCIAVSTGFVEELIFRRYILEKSLSIFNDSIGANSFATILFTLIHLPIIIFVYGYSVPATLSYLSIIGISGFIYGLVYLKNKSLSAATMTHAVWNFLGTIIK